MDFSLTEEQQQIEEMVAEFVDEEVVPRAAEIDKKDEFPYDLVDQLAELGLMGMPFPEEYGGAGLDYHAYPAAVERLQRLHKATALLAEPAVLGDVHVLEA